MTMINLTSRSSLVPKAMERGKRARTAALTSNAGAGLVTTLVRTGSATPVSSIFGALLWLTLLFASAPQTFAQGGIPLWTNRYNGPVNGPNDLDRARAMAVDSNGNVFVTGYSSGGSSANDYATIKYSSAGVALWTNRYNGPANGTDSAYAMAVDSTGNVFVTGYSFGGTSAYDYATIKYSGAGVALWTNRYNGPGNGTDTAQAVAVDGSGSVFVTGYSFGGTKTSYDYSTIKYSNAGVALWTNRYDGGATNNDIAQAIAVDSSGNVFVTGYSYGGVSANDYATIKYSSAGVALWTNRYNGPANGSDTAQAVAVDSSGNVLVTGQSYGGTNTSIDYATIKYSSAGVTLWTNRYSGPGSENDQPSAVVVDNSGNVFVTGYAIYTNTYYVYATIKYSSTGAALWTNYYGGLGAYASLAMGVDGGGNVFVTGAAPDWNVNTADYVTLAYSSGSVALWTNRYDGSGNINDLVSAMAVDSSGNVFVTGGRPGDDYVTIKFSSSLTPPRLSIIRDGSGGWFIRHTGVPDMTYRLQAAANLTGPWSDRATNIMPHSGLIESHETSPPPGRSFYRVIQP